MRRTGFAVCVLGAVFGSQAAAAADMGRPVYKAPMGGWNWTGVYLGFHGGYGGDSVDYAFTAPAIPLTGTASVTSGVRSSTM